MRGKMATAAGPALSSWCLVPHDQAWTAFEEPAGDPSDSFRWADPWGEPAQPAALNGAEGGGGAGGSALEPPLEAKPRARRPRLFGNDVFSLPPGERERYSLCWPMRGGRLDVRKDQPLQRVLDAIEARPGAPPFSVLLSWRKNNALRVRRLHSWHACLLTPRYPAPPRRPGHLAVGRSGRRAATGRREAAGDAGSACGTRLAHTIRGAPLTAALSGPLWGPPAPPALLCLLAFGVSFLGVSSDSHVLSCNDFVMQVRLLVGVILGPLEMRRCLVHAVRFATALFT